jgi:3-dehydroquinate dehydratase/shikimate dehydrogenase
LDRSDRRSGRATLVATLTTPLPGAGLDPADLAGVEWLEVRADLIGDIDPDRLRARFPGKLLFTLRSRDEGGAGESSPERRARMLIEAAARFDLVDLEAARDLGPEVLRAIPPERRILSWHGGPCDLEALAGVLAGMVSTPAALYKLVPAATKPGEELPPLHLLAELRREGRADGVAAFASGAGGVWTRFVAPYLGAPVVYGALGELPGAPGQPTIARLRGDYGLPELRPIERLFGIAGNPVAHSLSPRLHNAAYRELGIPALYLPFHAESFGDFWLEVVEGGGLEGLGFPLRGLSVTAPYKEAALAVAGAESPLVTHIGAANTLVWNDGVWEAEATDPDGVVLPLRDRGIAIAGRAAAVVGAGGAGRSAAVGLIRAGAEVMLFNRDDGRGRAAAERLRVPCEPLETFDPGRFDVVVQATSLGRQAGDPLPFAVEELRPGAVLLDLVYLLDRPTPLLAAAARRGVVTVDGREVLVDQARGQFRMMTGRELPVELSLRLAGLSKEDAVVAGAGGAGEGDGSGGADARDGAGGGAGAKRMGGLEGEQLP